MKASKILISFHSLKTKAKAQLELKNRMILIQAVLLLLFLIKYTNIAI